VQAALTQAQLPVWVDERPAILLWLAIEGADERKLIAEDSSHPARKIVQSVAAQRAIPMLLPLLDIEDLSQVSITDVLGGFDGALVEASSRYGADAVAIARVTRIRNDKWHADWRLNSGGRTLQWSLEGVSLAAVLTEGVHALADTFGQRLAVIENMSAQGGLLVAVEDVDSLEDYARLRGYLDDLALVQAHRLHLVQPGYASFWLQTSGEPADVRRLISLGAVLDEMPAPPNRGVGDDSPTLHFRLLR
jgi:hypothetical protein